MQGVAGSQLYFKKAMGFFSWSIAGKKPREIYAWIKEKRGESSVALCCSVLKVRREGYYDFLKRPNRKQNDEPLVSALKEIREEHPCYGTQRMINELPETLKPSYGKEYQIYRDNGLLTKKEKT